MKSSASAGTIATRAPEKAPTPAASASTPEPTMFLARLAIVLGIDAPPDGGRALAVAADSTGPRGTREPDTAEPSAGRSGAPRGSDTLSSARIPWQLEASSTRTARRGDGDMMKARSGMSSEARMREFSFLNETLDPESGDTRARRGGGVTPPTPHPTHLACVERPGRTAREGI
eukprot:scaffold16899_cov97-Isochrysis_galbana.AAC.2